MKKNISNGVIYYTFNIFDALNIKHCFSSKIGGVSIGDLESMNFSFYKDEPFEKTVENYKRIGDIIGFDINNLVLSDQTHSNNILAVDKTFCGCGIFKERNFSCIDGLMTNDANVVLTTFYADCVPVYFYDKKEKAIAVSHAGWKGTLNKIVEKTINEMNLTYSTKAGNLIIGIGASIKQCCFEVGEEVAEQFYSQLAYANDYIIKNKSTNKFNIDLQGLNKKIALDCGVLNNNIETSCLCTKCDSDIFYSHRKCGTNRGSLAAFITL